MHSKLSLYSRYKDQDRVITPRCFYSEVCIFLHDIVLFASFLHAGSYRGFCVQEVPISKCWTVLRLTIKRELEEIRSPEGELANHFAARMDCLHLAQHRSGSSARSPILGSRAARQSCLKPKLLKQWRRDAQDRAKIRLVWVACRRGRAGRGGSVGMLSAEARLVTKGRHLTLEPHGAAYFRIHSLLLICFNVSQYQQQSCPCAAGRTPAEHLFYSYYLFFFSYNYVFKPHLLYCVR